MPIWILALGGARGAVPPGCESRAENVCPWWLAQANHLRKNLTSIPAEASARATGPKTHLTAEMPSGKNQEMRINRARSL